MGVELPNLSRLPKVSVELPYACKENNGGDNHRGDGQLTGSPGSPGKKKKPITRKKSFEDGFTKLPMEQPHIADIIELKPGVNLQSAGKTKAGPQREDET